MNQAYKTLEFNRILEMLKERALTENAKMRLGELEPLMSENELMHRKMETTQARNILEQMGNPPLVSMKDMENYLRMADNGGFLLPEQLDYMRTVLVAIKRLKQFLEKCKMWGYGIAYYADELDPLLSLQEEIQNKIRGSQIEDHASKLLEDLRWQIERLDEKIREKAEGILKRNRNLCTDSFVTTKYGRICLPVKKECRGKIPGSVVEQSATGLTLFIEPEAVAELSQERSCYEIAKEEEERRILYELSAKVAEHVPECCHNIKVVETLDFLFAMGKLSLDMKAVEPEFTRERRIVIKNGRHPFLREEDCVPLNFEMGGTIRGIIITGPNTGGKTVTIKTVGLFCLMAQCGLHVPCERGLFCMNRGVYCDIGDGQDLSQNLSTFSAHITNVLSILRQTGKNSLVILDELGSGTDPQEGMGIAVAVLEELREKECLFLCTTHYPEVKHYAKNTDHIQNARMAFDKKTLKPLYRFESGEAGESCAFSIAKRLGMSMKMLQRASLASYGTKDISHLGEFQEETPKRAHIPEISYKKDYKKVRTIMEQYQLGDCVMVYPERKIGIVCRKANEKGVLQVQMKSKKIWINHKRIKLHVKAEQMYPEGYDFSIVFESVENRKKRHQMERKHCEGMTIIEEGTEVRREKENGVFQ